ncbi:hypothetical protein IV203_008172 [Nitzschia inconspicua]|uniref:Uncharacterized protein n=1 Tax=Nitzschia inconspicua TaxID=303405 RepID=A0A9K3PP53_9STRA|nr:hypothetical protein IV203_008172 [Nitzschia inconspicua]
MTANRSLSLVVTMTTTLAKSQAHHLTLYNGQDGVEFAQFAISTIHEMRASRYVNTVTGFVANVFRYTSFSFFGSAPVNKSAPGAGGGIASPSPTAASQQAPPAPF